MSFHEWTSLGLVIAAIAAVVATNENRICGLRKVTVTFPKVLASGVAASI